MTFALILLPFSGLECVTVETDLSYFEREREREREDSLGGCPGDVQPARLSL